MHTPDYTFLRQAGRILNSSQARTILLTGAIHDLFHVAAENDVDAGAANGRYVPLLSLLGAHWRVPDRILIVYELNGPMRFACEEERRRLRDAWLRLRTGLDADQLAVEQMLHAGKVQAELASMSDQFDAHMRQAIGKPTLALELLRQMCVASRSQFGDQPLLQEDLIIVVEAADQLIPDGEISRLSDADRHRVAICQDWFSDPGFIGGNDAVVLLAESRSLLNHRVAHLPQILEVEVAAADQTARQHFIDWFNARQPDDRRVQFDGETAELARLSAGLSIHALGQLLKGAAYEEKKLSRNTIIAKVEEHIRRHLGEDVVEFKKPAHTLDNVVGFNRLKEFLRTELIPRFRSSEADAISGAAIAGPIGSGKTFIFEAVAAELDMVVLVLKNIRSQWFGQTDVVFERLKRVLNALAKTLIFVDEADTQFGRLEGASHDTERRLTGKIQAMMSDPLLRGRVVWLLMTARIHRLSPDIRRPGRTGDFIIPVLDPDGEDLDEFIQWAVTPTLGRSLCADELEKIREAVHGYSAAGLASLRSELLAKAHGGTFSFEEIVAIARDQLPAEIGQTRRYQTLQALLNCTRRSLLPDPATTEAQREQWRSELRRLEREAEV